MFKFNKIIFLAVIFLGFFGLAHSASAVYPAPHHFRRRFILLAGAIAKRLRLGENLFVKFFQKMVPGPVAGKRKFLFRVFLLVLPLFFAVSFFCAKPAYGATEFISTVMQSGGDYSTLNTWETGVQTDLTSAATQVFSGTKTGTIADNTVVYLCRSGVYQSHSGTTVHATATQILVELISGAATEQSGDIWYTNNTCDSANYFTISDGGDSAIAIAQIDGAWTSADTTAVTINGWTTDATHYIKIYTTTAARHDGKWNEGKYRLGTTTPTDVLAIQESYTQIEGLQVEDASNGGSTSAIVFGSGTEVRISHNIAKKTGTLKTYGILCSSSTANAKCYVYNNIVYDFIVGGDPAGGGIVCNNSNTTAYVYNNTVHNSYYGIGITSWFGGTIVAKNNIVQDSVSGDGYYWAGGSGGFDASSDYNLSDVAGDAPGANSRNETTVTFVNEAGDDFHLAPNDAGARNYGIDLNPDTYLTVTDDIDGQTRPDGAGTWDIGADEAANNVYYSVGQDGTTDRKVASNVTISSGVASFVTAQTGNIGVGDRVTYETGVEHICYISAKQSTSVWNLVTATGAACPDHTSTDVVSIKREFTSLSSAISLSSNSGHINNTDLVAANVVLNIPCYYDSAADTTDVTVTGYTTGANNYIKIYTPNNTSTECNTSQRHDGKWNEGKYRLEVNWDPIDIREEYVRIEGLQIKLVLNDTSWRAGIRIIVSSGDVRISHNIVRGVFSGTSDWNYGILPSISSDSIKIWNNIVYDFTNGSYANNKGIGVDTGNIYIYNNTVYNSTVGIGGGITTVAKNNLSYLNDYDYNGTFDASSNYNFSKDDTAPGANSIHGTTDGKTPDFVNVGAGVEDFHLQSTSDAIDVGTNNPGSGLFSDDIDGEERPGTWDIGADEQPGVVYHAAEPRVEGLTSGLVLYQSFDGPHMDWSASSAEARDQSGQGNNGDVIGATAAAGKIGQALGFDGTSNYAKTASNIALSSNIITTSFWLNWDTFANNDKLAMELSANFNDNNGTFLINPNSSSGSYFEVAIHDVGGWRAERFTRPSAGVWHHYSFIFDNSTSAGDIIVYVDGVEQSTSLGTNNKSGSGNFKTDTLYFMSRAGSSLFGAGTLDEVRVYNRALSETEIGDLYRMGQVKINKSWTDSLKNGLVGMWSFDGPDIDWSTNTAYDRSGSIPANDGTISGATAAIGKRGQGLRFDGDDDEISVADTNNSLDGINQVTLSTWFRPTSLSAGWHIIAGKGNNAANYGLWHDGDSFVAVFYSGGWQNHYTVNTYTPNNWYHLAMVIDNINNTVRIYVNGVDDTDSPAETANMVADNDPFYIAPYYGSRPEGLIDEVRVYNRALSETEIGDLYRMGQVIIKR